jgi:hypothetical protein
MEKSARDTWQHLGDRFSGEHARLGWDDAASLLGILLLIAGFIWMLRWLHQLHEEGWFAMGQMGLFHELASAHRLDRKARRLLLKVARHNDVAPAMLFLRGDMLQVAELKLSSEEHVRLEWLAQQLYAVS